jgi:C4-type Zn-finger protein
MADGHWIIVYFVNGRSICYEARSKEKAEESINEIRKAIHEGAFTIRITDAIGNGVRYLVVQHIVEFAYAEENPHKED